MQIYAKLMVACLLYTCLKIYILYLACGVGGGLSPVNATVWCVKERVFSSPTDHSFSSIKVLIVQVVFLFSSTAMWALEVFLTVSSLHSEVDSRRQICCLVSFAGLHSAFTCALCKSMQNWPGGWAFLLSGTELHRVGGCVLLLDVLSCAGGDW